MRIRHCHSIGFFIGWPPLAHAACRRLRADPIPSASTTLQGQILVVAADHKEATIKHEDIKGFMAAMTMPYKVRDAKEYDGLAPGDLINATLVVVSNDAYLKNVKKVGDAPLRAPPPTTLARRPRPDSSC